MFDGQEIQLPKIPMNAFSRFCKDQYPVFKKEYPNFKSSEIVHEINTMWKQLTD